MAPDLNSVPSSPRNHAQQSSTPSPPTSRRPSQMTGTPLLPGVTSSGTVQQDTTQVPLRHPRPLTAAELHLELEKEQEAVVNRLTRELSALRAQHSASVASTGSSSSAIDNTPHASTSTDALHAPTTPGHIIQGPTHYTESRRHRSSSNLSSRSRGSVTSQSANAGPAASTGVSPAPAVPVTGTSQASVDRARDAVGMRSRENSLAGVGLTMPSRSRAPSVSPMPSPMVQQPGLHGTFEQAGSYIGSGSQSHRQSVSSTTSASAATRQEDLMAARAALEVARKENEMLVARVKELEGMVRGRQDDRPSSSHATSHSAEASTDANTATSGAVE